jgi:fatty-acyl-CoA synthase
MDATPPATLSALLARNLDLRGESVAFVEGGREIAYREFDAMVRRSAAWLAGQGVKPGDRVAVWLVNRMEWLALYFGLARLGAALMTVNTRYRSHELAYILERSQASLLVLQLNFRKIDFPAVLRDVPLEAARALRKVVVVDAGEDMPAEVLGRPTIRFDLAALPDAGTPDAGMPDAGMPDAPCVLFTTSGTTSGPKLVVHTQYTIAQHALNVVKGFDLEADDARLLAALPLCGTFGLSGVMAAFAAGRPVVLMDTFDGPEAARLLNAQRITHLFGSDEMFQRIIESAPAGDRPFPHARVFGFASFQPGALEVTQKAWARGMPMIGLYGSSEVQALFSLQDRGLPLPERSLGGGRPACPAARIRIRDAETGALLPAGQVGAVEIKSPTNFVGYLDNPEATAGSIDAEGYFSTGDAGYLREDGSFVYQTRLGDAMRLGGYLVSPAEIENVVKTVPGVQDVQIVAVEIGPQMKPVAFVVAQPGRQAPAEAAVVAAAKAVLAPFKVPARVWVVDEFPVTQSSNGTKIQRVKLREMALERLAQTPAA